MIKSTLKLAAGSSLLALFALVACSEESAPSNTTDSPNDTELSAGGGAGAPSGDVSNPAGTGGQGEEQPNEAEPDEVELTFEVPVEVLVRRGGEVSFEANVSGAKWADVSVSLLDAPAGITLTQGADGNLTIAAGPGAIEGEVEVTLRVESGELTADETVLVTVAGSPGSRDTSFQGTGKVEFDSGHELLVDAEGRLLVLYSSSNSASHIARYLPDGTLDPDFDEDGVVNLSFIPNSIYNQAASMTLMPNGDVAITGTSTGGSSCLMRLDSSGQRTGLDGDGRVCLPIGSYIMPFGDDAMLVSGNKPLANPHDAAAFKVTVSGEMDPAFGDGDGQTEWPTPQDDYGSQVLPMGTGFLLPATEAQSFSLVRFDSKGDLMTTFATGGHMDFPGHNLRSALPGPDGRSFLATRKTGASYALVLDDTGNGDAGYGDGGVINLGSLDIYGVYPSDQDNELWLQVYVPGTKLARIDAQGTLDTDFGYVDLETVTVIEGFAVLPRGRVAALTGDGKLFRIWR